MVLQPGSWVTETVRLERPLARGGMGEVWQAEHVTLGTKVAVKCLSPRLAVHGGAVTRFLREAQILATVNEPHLVRVLDCVLRKGPAGEPSGFIVMELLEGEDLGACLAREGPLSLERTAGVVDQVASALEAAHRTQIVHRDVKPENIFLGSRDGRLHVKLLDFGVGKHFGSAPKLTLGGTTVGTPPYMSPEQLESARDVDSRCDVWSLAVVAFACLTGSLPFEGATVGAVSAAIQEGGLRPPSSRRDGLPPWIDEVFATAFHRRIELRFQRARDLAVALFNSHARPVEESAPRMRPATTSRVQVIGEAYARASPPIPVVLPRPIRGRMGESASAMAKKGEKL